LPRRADNPHHQVGQIDPDGILHARADGILPELRTYVHAGEEAGDDGPEDHEDHVPPEEHDGAAPGGEEDEQEVGKGGRGGETGRHYCEDLGGWLVGEGEDCEGELGLGMSLPISHRCSRCFCGFCSGLGCRDR